jgi:hypothetical protein
MMSRAETMESKPSSREIPLVRRIVSIISHVFMHTCRGTRASVGSNLGAVCAGEDKPLLDSQEKALGDRAPTIQNCQSAELSGSPPSLSAHMQGRGAESAHETRSNRSPIHRTIRFFASRADSCLRTNVSTIKRLSPRSACRRQ